MRPAAEVVLAHGSPRERSPAPAPCNSAALAPQIALRVQASDFPVAVCRTIAAAALGCLADHGRPASVYLPDVLEAKIKRGPDGAMS
jgi:hypothetical protein